MGIATFSPLLDEKGNSICGIKALEYLSQKMELSVY
ncbi:MAG: glutaminase [Lawsonibacter sp.]|nr:glutaminase [Lawsonibacter sp.]